MSRVAGRSPLTSAVADAKSDAARSKPTSLPGPERKRRSARSTAALAAAALAEDSSSTADLGGSSPQQQFAGLASFQHARLEDVDEGEELDEINQHRLMRLQPRELHAFAAGPAFAASSLIVVAMLAEVFNISKAVPGTGRNGDSDHVVRVVLGTANRVACGRLQG